MTGTEAEFVAAYDLHQAQESGDQRCFVSLLAQGGDRHKLAESCRPDGAALGGATFFKQTETGGLRPMLVQSFETAEQLTKMVERDINDSREAFARRGDE